MCLFLASFFSPSNTFSQSFWHRHSWSRNVFSKPGKVQNCGGLAPEALAPVLRTSDRQPASNLCQIDPKTHKTTWSHLNMSLRIGFLESHPVQGWLTTRCPGASLKPSRAYHCPGFTKHRLVLLAAPISYPLPAPLQSTDPPLQKLPNQSLLTTSHQLSL